MISRGGGRGENFRYELFEVSSHRALGRKINNNFTRYTDSSNFFFLDTLDRSTDGEISSHHRETSFEAGRYLESTPSIAI